MPYNKNGKSINKKLLIILGIIVAIFSVTLLLIILEISGRINLYESIPSNQQTLTNDQNGINYNPPTQQEVKSGDEQKENLPDANTEPEKPNSANIVIVDANQYGQEIEVRAFVSNVVNNGTCEIVFEKGSQKIIKSVNAYADASTTPCMNLVVPRSEFPESGDWKVTVSYDSTEIRGQSVSTLEIQ